MYAYRCERASVIAIGIRQPRIQARDIIHTSIEEVSIDAAYSAARE